MNTSDKAPALLVNPESTRFVASPLNTGSMTMTADDVPVRFKVVGLLGPKDMQAGREYRVKLLLKPPKNRKLRRRA